MDNGVIPGRILCNSGNNGTFGQIKFIYLLVKITKRCGLDTQGILSQVDGIHVVYQNGILIHYLFQLNSQVLLLDFTF